MVGARWTSDDHPAAMKPSPGEAASIARYFKTKDFTAFMSNGVRVEDQTYQFWDMG